MRPAQRWSVALCVVAIGFHTGQANPAQLWEPVLLAAAPTVSEACTSNLRRYVSCEVTSSLYTACSSFELLNSSDFQQLLNCSNAGPDPVQKIKVCQARCFAQTAALLNQTNLKPCSADIQAMRSFSGALDIFTMERLDEENISHSVLFPLPNIKGTGSFSVVRLGDASKCVGISTAQYCVITGKMLSGGIPMTFMLGNCLPSSCSADELSDTLGTLQSGATQHFNLKVQCGLVKPIGSPGSEARFFQDFLGWGGVPVEYPKQIKLTGGTIAVGLVIVVLFLFMAAGTALDVRRRAQEAKHRQLRLVADSAEAHSDVLGRVAPVEFERGTGSAEAYASNPGQEARQPLTYQPPEGPRPRGKIEGFLHHWSLFRNNSSFLRARPDNQNSFACMDAIRVLSMVQVILGHMFVYPMFSSGFSNMEQFNPPNGQLGSVWFMMIPGCFYGVDSFFLMSGFLCCYGLQRKVFSKPGNRTARGFLTMYPKFFLMRYLRLMPLEMFCIAFSYFILPHLGTGVLWNLDQNGGQCYQGAGSRGCDKYWWTNLLFIQDVDRYAGGCYAHTWYLANDMQLYLTAPFFTLAYALKPVFGWIVLGLGLLVGVVSPVWISVREDWVPDAILAGNDYNTQVYFKPWCRCTPFLVGIGVAWLWQEHLHRFKGYPVSASGRLASVVGSLLGVGLCCFSIFGRAFFFQCELSDCSDPQLNPVPRALQLIWAGGSILCWAVGLSTVMVLCFQGRFLPVIQELLNHSIWQPIAKLSYAAYLIHTSVLILDFCQLTGPLDYNGASFVFMFVSFVVLAMSSAYVLFMLVEKPLANLQMQLLGGGGGE